MAATAPGQSRVAQVPRECALPKSEPPGASRLVRAPIFRIANEQHRVPGAGDPLIDAATPLLSALGVRPFAPRRPRLHRPANSRLVALTGLAILVLLPIPYGTALFLDVLWRVHYFSALLLIPLLGVKLGATAWRAMRYYLGDAQYRADGPPHLMPRLTAPILVLSTGVLFGSGVLMMLGADRFGPWSTIHNGAAIIFTGALGLHLLAHLWDTPREVAVDVAPALVAGEPHAVPGSRRRLLFTVAAFMVGLTVAAIAAPTAQWATSRPPGLHHRDG